MNYVTELEQKELRKLATSVNRLNNIVEIGVYQGKTSELLCQANPWAQVIGIDPCIPDSMKPEMRGDAKKLAELENLYNNYLFVHDYSYRVVENYLLNNIGLLFIDGDHHKEAVKKDFEDWYPKVVRNGFISFHDASHSSVSNFKGWPGPVQLVEELKQDTRLQLYSVVDTLVTFIKL